MVLAERLSSLSSGEAGGLVGGGLLDTTHDVQRSGSPGALAQVGVL